MLLHWYCSSVPYTYYPSVIRLLASNYFCILCAVKTIQLSKCSALSGHSCYDFSLSAPYTFYNINTFSYFSYNVTLWEFASNALHNLCFLKPFCSNILYATDTIPTLNKTEDFKLFFCIHVFTVLYRWSYHRISFFAPLQIL